MGYYTRDSDMDKRTDELSYVNSQRKDIQIEEFPEGPYSASVFLDQPLGKSSEWEPGQQVVSRYKDENPAFSNRKVPEDEIKPDF